MKCRIIILSILILILAAGITNAAGIWKIDMQGDENHDGVYGQTDPVDMTEPGVYWNILEVPALNAEYPGPVNYVLDPSWTLVDDSNSVQGVTFSITGQAWGWAGDYWQESVPLQGDYLLVLNGFTTIISADPTNFQITGLVPNLDYKLILYHALNYSDRGIAFDIESITTSLYGYPSEASVDTIWVTSDETGTITGVAASLGYEGNWSGLIIEAPIKAHNPDPKDGAVAVALDKVLTWTTGRDPNSAQINPLITKHFVWMSSGDPQDPNLVLVDTITTIEETGSYNPGGMNRDEQYWWRVDEGINDLPVGDPNNIIGDVWTFKTLPSVVMIDQQPASALVYEGEDVVYTVAATNPFTEDSTNLEYAWYKVGDDITVLSTTDTLTITAAALADEGQYYCVVGVIDTPGSETATDNASLTIKKVMLNVPLDGDTNDTSVFGYVGVLTGDAAFTTNAVLGQAISLDGLGDYVNFGDVVVTDTGMMSISVWAKPGNIARDWTAIVAKWAADASTKTFWFGQAADDGWIRFGIYPDNVPNAENVLDSGRPVLQNGKWTHIVCSYDGQYQHLFADSLLVATSNARSWLVSDGDGDLCIGHIAQDGGDFQGIVDEVRIYNYQLTNEEVADLYLESPDKDYVCAEPPQYDFDGDCLVTLNDFVNIAAEWLICGTYPTCITEIPD